MTPWTGACTWSGINSSPFATIPFWNGPTPIVKQVVLFGPFAPGTMWRSLFGIRVIFRFRHPGATDIPLASRATLLVRVRQQVNSFFDYSDQFVRLPIAVLRLNQVNANGRKPL
jgi:hypothetical protein